MRVLPLLWLTACGGACPEVVASVTGGTAAQRRIIRDVLDELRADVVPDAWCVRGVEIRDGPIDGIWGGQFGFTDDIAELNGRLDDVELGFIARHEVCHAIDLAGRVLPTLYDEGLEMPALPPGQHRLPSPAESWAYQCTDGFDALRFRIAEERGCGDASSTPGLARAVELAGVSPPFRDLEVEDARTLLAPPGMSFGWPPVFHDDVVRLRLEDAQHAAEGVQTMIVPLDARAPHIEDGPVFGDPSPAIPGDPGVDVPRGLFLRHAVETTQGTLFTVDRERPLMLPPDHHILWQGPSFVGIAHDGDVYVRTHCRHVARYAAIFVDVDAQGRGWVYETDGETATFYRPVLP